RSWLTQGLARTGVGWVRVCGGFGDRSAVSLVVDRLLDYKSVGLLGVHTGRVLVQSSAVGGDADWRHTGGEGSQVGWTPSEVCAAADVIVELVECAHASQFETRPGAVQYS